jgi:hypothetical protein
MEGEKQIPFDFAQAFGPLTPIALLCDWGPKHPEPQDDTSLVSEKSRHAERPPLRAAFVVERTKLMQFVR